MSYKVVFTDYDFENIDIEKVFTWLKNSWNTEMVLSKNKDIIIDTGEPFAMQWAFPQAYYTCFTSILALFKTLGYTQERHTSVLKEYGVLASNDKYPCSLAFYATGGMNNITFQKLTKNTNTHKPTYIRNFKK